MTAEQVECQGGAPPGRPPPPPSPSRPFLSWDRGRGTNRGQHKVKAQSQGRPQDLRELSQRPCVQAPGRLWAQDPQADLQHPGGAL